MPMPYGFLLRARFIADFERQGDSSESFLAVSVSYHCCKPICMLPDKE
jgi:hypothetical protein